jgi:hypothetical protein
MNIDDQIQTELNLPPVHQIGVLTKDIKKAIDYYVSQFGLGPFTVYEFTPDKVWYKEEPSHYKAIYGKTMLGDIELCLMQPLEGESIQKEFIEKHGDGLFNLGFHVQNYEEMFDKFLKAGFNPLARAESYVSNYNGYVKGCYFDTQKVGGIIFELLWMSWVK